MTFRDSFALLSCRLYSISFVKKINSCKILRNIHMDKEDERKSHMEIVKIPPMVSIYRHALHTFDDNHKNDIQINLSKLKTMMDALKAEDLCFDQELCNPERWNKPKQPPCTYVEVFQNDTVNMSIFVLKPGFKMPLHDHPEMHGLLRVIAGAVRIRSFTEYPLTIAQNTVDFATRAKFEAARIANGIHKRRRLFAEVTQQNVCKANSDTCLLTPTVSNFHEIEALDMPAAFFDILAPPYDTRGPRKCRYYYVANEISTNLVELQEMSVPDCFVCDQSPYLGPVLL